jgi:hypothetical protein
LLSKIKTAYAVLILRGPSGDEIAGRQNSSPNCFATQVIARLRATACGKAKGFRPFGLLVH